MTHHNVVSKSEGADRRTGLSGGSDCYSGDQRLGPAWYQESWVISWSYPSQTKCPGFVPFFISCACNRRNKWQWKITSSLHCLGSRESLLPPSSLWHAVSLGPAPSPSSEVILCSGSLSMVTNDLLSCPPVWRVFLRSGSCSSGPCFPSQHLMWSSGVVTE